MESEEEEIASVPESELVPPSDTISIQDSSKSLVSPDAASPFSPHAPPSPPPYSAFSPRQRKLLILMASAAGVFSPLASNIYFPALPEIADTLGVSIGKANLTITFFMVFQGLAPSVWGSITDVHGRRIVYLFTFLVFFACNIVLALPFDSYILLLLFRMFQAAGSSSVIAVGAGTIGDIASPAERGSAMGNFNLGVMLGTCIGPVLGGILAQKWNYHALFWFLAIATAVFYVIVVLFMPETMRKMVGNGTLRPRQRLNRPILSPLVPHQEGMSAFISQKIPNPLAPLLLFREKDMASILCVNALLMLVFYCSVATLSSLIKEKYNLSTLKLGLCFIANGGGCITGSYITGKLLDRDYRYTLHSLPPEVQERLASPEAKKDLNNLRDFPIEHARLRSMWMGYSLMVVSVIAYGWCLEKRVYIAWPLMLQFFVGLSLTCCTNIFSTLLVDLYPTKSASSTAANNLARCALGAVGTAVIDYPLNAIGAGWTFVILVGINLAFLPLMILEWTRGMRWRNERAEVFLASPQL